MSTDITICNQALSLIGARAEITALADVSKEAKTCNLWYDSCRQDLLRSAHWSFARKQLALDELGNAVDNTSLYPWQFMYEYPEDCLKVRYLLPPPPTSDNDVIPAAEAFVPWAMPSRAHRFIVGQASIGTPTPVDTKVILTNVEEATGVYTADVTTVSLFDKLFESALVHALAATIVLPLSGNVAMKGTFESIALGAVNRARAMDGNEAMPSTDHVPDWIATRGYVGDPYYSGPGIGQWYASWDSVPWGE